MSLEDRFSKRTIFVKRMFRYFGISFVQIESFINERGALRKKLSGIFDIRTTNSKLMSFVPNYIPKIF